MESVCLWACMAKGTNKKLQKCDGHCMVLVNVHRTGEGNKNLLFLLLAHAGLSQIRCQPASTPLTPNPVAQPGLCLHGFFPTQWGYQGRESTDQGKQGSSWEEDPAVRKLAQCLFLERQHQGGWWWRPALPQLHLSHLDEGADPHAGPKIQIIVCNHHWSFKAEATLPALSLLPCASSFVFSQTLYLQQSFQK